MPPHRDEAEDERGENKGADDCGVARERPHENGRGKREHGGSDECGREVPFIELPCNECTRDVDKCVDEERN